MTHGSGYPLLVAYLRHTITTRYHFFYKQLASARHCINVTFKCTRDKQGKKISTFISSNSNKMWTCPICNQQFVKTNQSHSCKDKTLQDFLNDKSAHTLELFDYFIEQYKLIGDISIHPTKSMIAIGARTRFAYITQLGKNFIDIVFPFKQSYDDNLCFIKIKPVPGSDDYNHYFRMCFKEDVNAEVRKYMKLAYKAASLSYNEDTKDN